MELPEFLRFQAKIREAIPIGNGLSDLLDSEELFYDQTERLNITALRLNIQEVDTLNHLAKFDLLYIQAFDSVDRRAVDLLAQQVNQTYGVAVRGRSREVDRDLAGSRVRERRENRSNVRLSLTAQQVDGNSQTGRLARTALVVGVNRDNSGRAGSGIEVSRSISTCTNDAGTAGDGPRVTRSTCNSSY